MFTLCRISSFARVALLVALALGAALTGALLTGCNIVGPVVAVASGPPTTPARYELDAKRTHVIFIDDLRSRLPKRSLRDVIAQHAEQEILSRGLLKEQMLISSAAARRVAASESAEAVLPITDIGRRVGADVVIYITIDTFTLSRDGVSATPTVVGRMKILDVAENRRIWPGNEEGYSVIVQPQHSQGDLPRDLAGRSSMEIALCKRYGLAIAQTFYKHETRHSATTN